MSENYTIYAEITNRSYGSEYFDFNSYSEGRIFKYELSKGKLIDTLTECMVINKKADYDDTGEGYDPDYIVILNDGHPISEEEKILFLASANDYADKAIAKELELQAKIKAEKERKQEEKNLELQRSMYESLKKKFEPQSSS